MLIAFIIIYILLILPLFIRFRIGYFNENKKLYFTVYLFSFIKLLYGYIEKIDNGLAIHINGKKTFIFNFNNIFSMKSKVKPLMDYHIKRFYSVIEIGGEKLFNNLAFSFFYNYINERLIWLLKCKKNYIKVQNDLNIIEDENIFSVYMEFTVILNILMILLSFIKILMGKIINGISKRKQSKQSNGNYA